MPISPFRLAALCSTCLLLVAAGCASTPTTDDAPTAQESDADDDAQALADAFGEAEPDSEADDGDYVVEFRDRIIDLHPYVQGFPYSSLMPQLEEGFMLYFETTPEGKWLRHITFDDDGDEIDISDGDLVHDIDWSTRSFSRGEYNPVLDRFIFMGDERNDEIFNLYTLDIDSGDVEMLTDVDYIYGYGFSDDDSLLGYVARHGSSEPFNSCLHIRDLDTGDDTEIWCDEGGDDRLTWTYVDFGSDNDSAMVRMQHDGDRNRTNLGRFDLTDAGAPEQLLERGTNHRSLWWVRDTLDDEKVLYISAKEDTNQIYRYDFETGDSKILTELDQDITGATILEEDGKPPLLMVTLDLPYGTIVELRDPEDGKVLWSETKEESVRTRDYDGARLLWSMSSVDTPFRMERVELRLDAGIGDDLNEDTAVGLETGLFAAIPDELADQLVQCDVERVEYPTFDEVDGEPRMLHAYLFEPRDQPPQHQRLAQITAFYGGGNYFRSSQQIMCEAGITSFSPAPRGSRGFGAEFRALNDGDLGGDDIIDIFYAARWLESERGFTPEQIGVHGGSHGGYATMRALTFPPETNERGESYDFGFGYSHAGISDLLHFYNTSNIPDWLVLLAGDPETEPDKLRERSPLTHVERLQSPLLLTHGSHDSRVPVDESRRFAEAAQEHDLPVIYEEFEGQGHGLDGLANRMRYYRAIFNFLENEVVPHLEEDHAEAN